MEQMVEWLRSQGEMRFEDFVQAARAAGYNPADWRKAYRRGLITTRLETQPAEGAVRPTDVDILGHYISAV